MQLFSSGLRGPLMILIWLVSVLALVLWLGGEVPTRVTVAAGPRGSESLALSSGIARAINAADLGFTMLVFETGGSTENLHLLETGRIDMGTLQADMPGSDAVQGIARLYGDAFHLIARKDAGIASFADLPGKRIAIPPKTSGQFESFWFLAEHFGMERRELNALPMSEEAADFAMEQGQVDAVFRVRAPGNMSISELVRGKDVNLVPLTQSAALALKQPAIAAGVIPKGSYRGFPALPETDMPTAIVDRLLVARADMDAHLANRITRAIYDYRSEILESSNLAGSIGPLPEDAASVIPAHPGARAYYDREKPGFVQENARLVSTFLYVVVIVSSAMLALRGRWARSRRIRIHGFNQQLMDIASGARTDSELESLLQRKQELIDILARVISDLERQQVNQDEFEHFSFTWQAVDALLRDRLNLLSARAEAGREAGL